MNMAEGTLHHRGDALVVALGDQELTVDPELAAERPALRNYTGRTVAVGVRSEDLFEPGPRNDAPADRRLRSTARLTEALGSEIVVHFEVPAPPVQTEDIQELSADAGAQDAIGTIEVAGTKFVASFHPRSHVKPGESIEVGVDTSRLYFFDLDTGRAIRT
jgi:multiple sugar transport system ATP-binding protein